MCLYVYVHTELPLREYPLHHPSTYPLPNISQEKHLTDSSCSPTRLGSTLYSWHLSSHGTPSPFWHLTLFCDVKALTKSHGVGTSGTQGAAQDGTRERRSSP